MKKLLLIKSFLIISLSCLFLTACEDEPKTPAEVTQAFWLALENKHVSSLEKLIYKDSLDEAITADNLVSISHARFGKIIIDSNIAEVETTVSVKTDEQEDVELNTQLVQINQQWKVDYKATIDELNSPSKLSQVIRDLRVLGGQFSEELSNELESSLNELDKAMPEIEKEIKDISEQLKEQVPELKKQFEGLAEELQQALEESLYSDDAEDDKSKAI